MSWIRLIDCVKSGVWTAPSAALFKSFRGLIHIFIAVEFAQERLADSNDFLAIGALICILWLLRTACQAHKLVKTWVFVLGAFIGPEALDVVLYMDVVTGRAASCVRGIADELAELRHLPLARGSVEGRSLYC